MKNQYVIRTLLKLTFLFSALITLFLIPVSAEAATYKMYTISSSNTRVYSNTGLTVGFGWIYSSDEITIQTLNSTYCKVTYPVSRGTKTGYVRTSTLFTKTSGSTYKAKAKVTTYRRPGGSPYGSIYANDSVLVLGTSGSYTQVRYPVSGGYKFAFIKTSDCNRYITGSSSYAIPSNGMYTIRSAMNNNMVIDVSDGSTVNGTNIQIWQSQGGNNQKFNISQVSTGWYKIIDVNSNKALDVAGGTKRSGVNVQLYQWNGTDAQLWRFYSAGNGYYYIQNKLGYYLDASGAKSANGTNIQVYSQNGGNNQKWKIDATSKYTTPSNRTTTATNVLVSASEIKSAASKYGINTSSNAYKALQSINTKYYSKLSSNKNGTNVFLFEGVGNNSSTGRREFAMCVVIRKGSIVYINRNSSTLPDNPFSKANNAGTPVPTIKSGVYGFTTCNHPSNKYGNYAALKIQSANAVRHRSRTSYYSASGLYSLNVHRKCTDYNSSPTATWGNSTGCMLIGKSNEYLGFAKAVGVIYSNASTVTTYNYSVTGKIVIDRTYAWSYLKNIGYTDTAIKLIG